MRELTFLANPASPHVQEWLRILPERFDGGVRFVHIGGDGPVAPSGHGTAQAPLPKAALRLPKALRYVLLGLWLRILDRSSEPVHAHNTSGYGLCALLSGRRYIVTTYGSEILQAHNRNHFYKGMIRAVLRGADRITATSPQMALAIAEIDPELSAKIETFSLGLSPAFLHPVAPRSEDAPRTWFVNRRITPHYRTLDVLAAFAAFKDLGYEGRLVLLKGDSDPTYLDCVRRAVDGRWDVEIIEDFLSPDQMREALDRADFCISTPISDQLSSAILEGMARGCVSVLSPLDAYTLVDLPAIYLSATDPFRDALTTTFRKTAEMAPEALSEARRTARNFVEAKFPEDAIRQRYEDLLVGMGS
jgi:glycosyltransferase involved in cell wall biosynthesis